MEIQVETTSRHPIYRQLVSQVREGVARGVIEPGEQLPSVRELARKLVVNPNTVARAMTELERDGVLIGRPGIGYFVAERGNDLTREARERRLLEGIDRLFTEAVHLGFAWDEGLESLEERAKKFRWNESKEVA